MQARPDSALHILSTQIDISTMNEANKAEYALLLTQALDKNYIHHQNDSLITIAVNHYKHSHDNNLKAKVYFYLGRVYQDNNEYAKATEAYLTALKTQVTEKVIISKIYNHLALCYENQESYIQALKTYQQSYTIANELKDNHKILHAIRGMANIYIIQDNEQQALFYYNKAFLIAQSTNDSLWQSAISCDIAKVYDSEGIYLKAHEYINRAIRFSPQSANLSSTYFWKGEILYDLEENDSAIHYLNEAIPRSDIYTKASIYHTLYEIEKGQRNYKQAITYNDTALVYYDSIQSLVHHIEMDELIRTHTVEIHKQEAKEKYQERKMILIISGICIISFFIFSLMLFKNHGKQKQIELQQLLTKNQTEKVELKEEIKRLCRTNEVSEKNRMEMQYKRYSLWEQSLKICNRLFQTTSSYKKIRTLENTKNKKEKVLLPEDVTLIHQEINAVFIEAIQEFSEQYPDLTRDDICFCILKYLQLSNETIRICMGSGSAQALVQRKYRINKQLSSQASSLLFEQKKDCNEEKWHS